MLKILLGALPVVDVKMPLPAASVRRSSQCARITLLNVVVGRHALDHWLLVLLNCTLPFELKLALLNTWPYSLTLKGSDIAVTPSSVWLPMSTVPGTIAAPVLCATW